MTEPEMWSIFEKCEGDPVMISQMVDWIMENDCSPELKLITDTLLWMRDDKKWPLKEKRVDDDLRWCWYRLRRKPWLSGHECVIEDGLIMLMREDSSLTDGRTTIERGQALMVYNTLFSAIEALDFALREMKSKFHRKEPTAFMRG